MSDITIENLKNIVSASHTEYKYWLNVQKAHSKDTYHHQHICRKNHARAIKELARRGINHKTNKL